MKRSFFQEAVLSILIYGCAKWTLTKRMEKKLDGNYTRMLLTILNKSWRQHPTKHQLYGHLPPITKTIKVRRTRHTGHFWRSREKLIRDVLLWIPSHGWAKAARTYIQQLSKDTGCSPEDLQEAMNGREEGRERVRDIRAGVTTRWWWWFTNTCDTNVFFKDLLDPYMGPWQVLPYKVWVNLGIMKKKRYLTPPRSLTVVYLQSSRTVASTLDSDNCHTQDIPFWRMLYHSALILSHTDRAVVYHRILIPSHSTINTITVGIEEFVGVICFVWLILVGFGFWYLTPFVFYSTPSDSLMSSCLWRLQRNYWRKEEKRQRYLLILTLFLGFHMATP